MTEHENQVAVVEAGTEKVAVPIALPEIGTIKRYFTKGRVLRVSLNPVQVDLACDIAGDLSTTERQRDALRLLWRLAMAEGDVKQAQSIVSQARSLRSDEAQPSRLTYSETKRIEVDQPPISTVTAAIAEGTRRILDSALPQLRAHGKSVTETGNMAGVDVSEHPDQTQGGWEPCPIPAERSPAEVVRNDDRATESGLPGKDTSLETQAAGHIDRG